MTKIEEFAQAFTAAVQDAFVKVYGPPADEKHLKSVRPSWGLDSVNQAWVKQPDPRVVVVGTEYGWVRDPYNSAADNKRWEKVAKILTDEGWGNVNWESINPAVHIVYIDVPSTWNSILMKQAMDRSR
jgi:hypothetical protein